MEPLLKAINTTSTTLGISRRFSMTVQRDHFGLTANTKADTTLRCRSQLGEFSSGHQANTSVDQLSSTVTQQPHQVDDCRLQMLRTVVLNRYARLCRRLLTSKRRSGSSLCSEILVSATFDRRLSHILPNDVTIKLIATAANFLRELRIFEIGFRQVVNQRDCR